MIDEGVLEQASFPYIFKDDKAKEVELQEFRSFIENISPEDFSQQ